MLGDHAITASYEANADYWITSIRTDADPYRVQITDPALLNALGAVAGLDVLDAGCGEGYFARRLSSLGAASVVGVDTCEAFIEAATDSAPPNCRFLLADVAEIPLPDDCVDVAVLNRIPHGLTRPAQRYHEFARLLRPGGRLIAIGQHPCFYSARNERSACESGDFPLGEYFEGRIVQQHFVIESEVSPAESIQMIYSLEKCLGMITGAGFVITGVREPRPTSEQLRADAQWRQRFSKPMFLLVEAMMPSPA